MISFLRVDGLVEVFGQNEETKECKFLFNKITQQEGEEEVSSPKWKTKIVSKTFNLNSSETDTTMRLDCADKREGESERI